MGQRANLVVVRNASYRLYYDHWCADRLDLELFWGADAATAFIEQLPPIADQNEWLDEVWCEGAAIIDHDRKVLLWFGGEDIMFDCLIRREFLLLMQQQWEGWKVRWAHGGIVEVGEYLGLPSEKFLTNRNSDSIRPFRVLTEYPQDNNTLLTVQNGGNIRGAQVFCDKDSIRYGAFTLSALDKLPLQAEVHWVGLMPELGLHINLDEHTLYYWFVNPVAAIEKRVSGSWAGWRTFWLQDRMEEHLRMVDIEIRLPFREKADIRRWIIDDLRRRCRYSTENPARKIAADMKGSIISPLTDHTRPAVGSESAKSELLDALLARLPLF